ncbi:ER degradation-enhancing alpha-mannosidase-like protein 1 [Smittium mucronatum]|uniref:alpha-1,2-Mannosidase n=1 Tax=Smittium mucronatum TaxID=133383 RepID=A0A1R0H1J5_9FUNG|nr:ER degradation-enhancing alpha-mannosidase-like protein 1 [Smittium mucronatum]
MNLCSHSDEIVDSKGDPWVYKGELLILARELGWRLLPAFEQSVNFIPFPRVNLRHGHNSFETSETCTAGAGSLDIAQAALKQLWFSRSKTDLVGNSFNIDTLKWTNAVAGVSAGVDSFYEYLFKGGIYLEDQELLDMFSKSYLALLYGSRDTVSGYLFGNVDMNTSFLSTWWVDSLSAYFPGLMVQIGDIPGAQRSYMIYYHLWRRFRSMPERFNLLNKTPEISFYPLRPEFIESTYFLYTATKDPFYLEVGEMILNDINSSMKTKCGYGGLRDLFKRKIDDRMESFALSETFKYLYLLFDIDNPINKGDRNAVFTTEAHYFPPLSDINDSPMQYPKQASFPFKKLIYEDKPPKSIHKKNLEFSRIFAKLKTPPPSILNVHGITSGISKNIEQKHILEKKIYNERPVVKIQKLQEFCFYPIFPNYVGVNYLEMLSQMNVHSNTNGRSDINSVQNFIFSNNSLDFSPSLPLRRDFDLVGSLVWNDKFNVSGEALNEQYGPVVGGITPRGEINSLILGKEWNLVCSRLRITENPQVLTDNKILPIHNSDPKNLTKDQRLYETMNIVASRANVWKNGKYLGLSFLQWLLSKSISMEPIDYLYNLGYELIRQRVINQLDLLPSAVFENLGAKNRNKSNGVLTEKIDYNNSSPNAKDEELKVIFSNGGRIIISDLVSVKLIIESIAKNESPTKYIDSKHIEIFGKKEDSKYSSLKKSDSNDIRENDDSKSIHSTIKHKKKIKYQTISPNPSKIQEFKEYIGRLSKLTFSNFHESSHKFSLYSEIVLPNMVIGRGSTSFGCEEYTPREKSNIYGNVVLIKRGGGCTFDEKAKNAYLSGAKALLVSIDHDAITFSENVDDIDKMYNGFSTNMKNDLWQYGGLIKIGSTSSYIDSEIYESDAIESDFFENSEESSDCGISNPDSAKSFFDERFSTCSKRDSKKVQRKVLKGDKNELKSINKLAMMPVISVYKEFYETVESHLALKNKVYVSLS